MTARPRGNYTDYGEFFPDDPVLGGSGVRRAAVAMVMLESYSLKRTARV
jgi:hypothetical protein